VRGFREGWMGPRDTNGNPFGGNLRVSSQLELIIPLPGQIGSATRFSLFADAGNIFSTDTTPFFDRAHRESRQLTMSPRRT
jgi:outer membrane protein insertion porin family